MNNRKKLKLMSLVGYAAALVGAAGYIEGYRIMSRGAGLSEKQIYAPTIDDETSRNVDRIEQLEKTLARVGKDGREEQISFRTLIRELAIDDTQRNEFKEYCELVSNPPCYDELLRRRKQQGGVDDDLFVLAVGICPVLLVGGAFYGFTCSIRAREVGGRK